MRDKIVLLVVLAFLLTSCYPQGQAPDKSRFYTGTKGISIDFFQDAPPREVYEDTEFPLIVSMHNRGAFDVPFDVSLFEGNVNFVSHYATVTVNYDDFYFEKLENDLLEARLQQIELKGKGDIVPSGEDKVLKVADLRARKVVGQISSPDTQVSVNVCYPYMTRLSEEVCIDSSAQTRNLREQVCRARDLSVGGGQGAPVTIERVEVDMVPIGQTTRPSFVIHVRNTGDGSVLRWFNMESDLSELCSLRGSREEVNKIWVQADIAGVPLDCDPNPFTLIGDNNKFFCIVPSEALVENRELFGRQDNFVTTLNVELMYIYTASTSRNIEIKRTDSDLLGSQYEEETGDCRAGQERNSAGNCVDICGRTGATQNYTCSCSASECSDLLEKNGQCASLGQDLCGNPGAYCCLRGEG